MWVSFLSTGTRYSKTDFCIVFSLSSHISENYWLFRKWSMVNSSNSQFYNFGAWHRSISGKLIQNRAFSQKMIFKEFRGGTKTDFRKTNPNMEKFSKNLAHVPIFNKNWIGAHKILMDKFSRNWSSSCPENCNFEKTGWVFQKSLSWRIDKIKVLKPGS